jgi:hypothetical protein
VNAAPTAANALPIAVRKNQIKDQFNMRMECKAQSGKVKGKAMKER